MARRDEETMGTSKAQRVSDSVRGIWEIVNKPLDPPVRRRNSAALITGGVVACLLFSGALAASGFFRDGGQNTALATTNSRDHKTVSAAAQKALPASRTVSLGQALRRQSAGPILNNKALNATEISSQQRAPIVPADIQSFAAIEPSDASTQRVELAQMVDGSDELADLESLANPLSLNRSIPPLNTVGGPIATRFARLNAGTEVATEPAPRQGASIEVAEASMVLESNQSQSANTMAIPATAPANAAGNPLPASNVQAAPRRVDSRVPLLPLPDFEPELTPGGNFDVP